MPAMVDEDVVDLDQFPPAPGAGAVGRIREELLLVAVGKGGKALHALEGQRVDVELHGFRLAEGEEVGFLEVLRAERGHVAPRLYVLPDVLQDLYPVDPDLVAQVQLGDLAYAASPVVVERGVGEVVEQHLPEPPGHEAFGAGIATHPSPPPSPRSRPLRR